MTKMQLINLFVTPGSLELQLWEKEGFISQASAWTGRSDGLLGFCVIETSCKHIMYLIYSFSGKVIVTVSLLHVQQTRINSITWTKIQLQKITMSC